MRKFRISFLKTAFLSCFVLMFYSLSFAQTTLISPTGDGGFETGATFGDNGWTSINHTTNIWSVGGAATPFAGTNGAYVSNNGGTTWAYTISSSQTSHFYRDITVPSGESIINLSFQWKGNGESSWDRLLVYTAPTSVTPVAGTPVSNSTTLSGATLIHTQANNTQATYTAANITLPSSLAGTTFRLIFTWQNDGSGGTSPGAAVDNINLTSAPPATYYWVGTATDEFNVAATWNTAADGTGSTRSTPLTTDILIIDGAGTTAGTAITGATINTSVSVGVLRITNNTAVTLSSSATTTRTITITGGSGDDFDIQSGSSLNLTNSTNAVGIVFSGTSNTGNIAGTITLSSSTSNTLTTTGGTGTLVTVGGTVNLGPAGGAITGSAATLTFSGASNYNHLFTTTSGTIPTATWNASSNININSFTSNTTVPSGLTGQNFGNLNWNCTAQTGNISLGGNTLTCAGTFTMTSTNTGSLRLGASTNGVITTNNFTQTGGTIDCSSGTGAGTIRASGTFNQSGGTITETSTGNGTIEFNGTSAQTVTFGGTISNTINYRINNNAGINLTGTMAITTGAGLRVSSTAATPINGGTLTYTGTTTLTYDASSGAQTVTTNEFPTTGGPTNLTINNTSTSPNNIVNLPLDRTVSGILTMTAGNIDLGANNLTLGTSTSALGTLTYTSGLIRVTSGTLTRWFGTSSLPTTTGGIGIGFYPLAFGANNRAVNVYFSSTTALTTGGTITVGHTDAGGTTAVAVTDGAYNIEKRTNTGWTVSQNGLVASGTISLRLSGGGISALNGVSTSSTNLRLMQASAITGTHVSSSYSVPNYRVDRTGFTVATLATTHYIGASDNDMPTIYNSITSGDWNSNSTWDLNSPPTCSAQVNINSTHNVTVNSASNQSKNVTINTGGTLTVASGDLTVGCTLNNNTLTNNGTLTVNGGTLNVNGNIISNLGSSFNQNGGNINIDGNAGGIAANSVASGVAHLQINQLNSEINLTGGTLTIVDPHANSIASNVIAYSNATTGTQTSTSNHTLRLGDGVSTDAGGNAVGFRINSWASNAYLSFGNIEINGGNGTNRLISSVYQLAAVGNVTVKANSTLNFASSVICGGDFTVETSGTFINTDATAGGLTMALIASNTSSSLTFGPSTVAQSIINNGTISNLATSPTANLNLLQILNSNAAGVTINSPISVSGTLTLSQGIVNTTSTNILRLGTTTTAGTLSGGSSTAYINGPFARTFAASRPASGTYNQTTLFPVGKSASSAYLPIHIDPATTSGGPVLFSGEAFTSNAGTGASGVTSLSNNRWEALITSGSANFTSTNIRLNDAAITASNKILQASSAASTYGTIIPNSTFAAGTPNTLTTTGSQILAAAYTGYFAYGDLTPCVAPADQPTNLTQGSNTSTTIAGTFTAAASSPSGYLVVRSSGALSASPVDGTTYAVGATLGNGTVIQSNANSSFSSTSLATNTAYTITIFSYNNVSCSGGPAYLTTSPLTGSLTTCPAAPTSPVNSNITSSGFTVSWNASAAGGGAGTINYTVEVYTDATYTMPVSGSPFSAMTNLFQAVSGLNGNTTYYYRINANNGTCNSTYLTGTTITECTSELAPTTLQSFTTYTPTCWKEATGVLAANTTLSGTSSDWVNASGFANTGTNPGAKINLYSTGNDWLISQPIDLGMTPNLYRLSYKMAVTSFNGTISQSTLGTHKVDVVVSTDGGLTWSNANIIKTYTGAGTYSNTGQTELINLPTLTGVVKFAFVATTTSTSPDIDFHIDDFLVELIPIPTISMLGTLSGCPGNNLVITGTNLEGATPANVQIGGTPVASIISNTGTVLTVVVGAGTTGTVSVTIGANTATSTDTYTVNPKPSASASSNTPVCVGNTINLDGTTNAGMGATLNWSGPNSFTSTSEDPMITGVTSAAAGTYTFTATSALGCTSDPATTVVIVNSLPSIPTAGSNSPVCLGSILNLTAANVILPYSVTNNSGVSFIDINATGTNVTGALGDDSEHNLTIPSFTFNNVAYTTARVGVNGLIVLGSNSGNVDFSNAALPSTANPAGNIFIAPYWDDLDINLSGTIKTETVGSKYIVQFTNIDHNLFTTGGITFQVQFDLTTSQIHLVYQDVIFGSATYDAGISATVGIQYSSTQATQFSFNSASLTNGQSITFTPAVPTYSWTGPNSFTSSLQNPTIAGITIAGAGVYTVTVTNPSTTCSNTSSATVTIATTAAVTSSSDAGAGSLRAAIACVAENGIITYDQPTTTTTILTAPLTIDKNVTIQGLSDVARPEITTDPSAASGIIINADKTLTLQNVDIKSTNPDQTFSGAGNVSITGLTISKP